MRENSGRGESNNNNLDPTVEEHKGGKGPAQRSGGMAEGGGAPFDDPGHTGFGQEKRTAGASTNNPEQPGASGGSGTAADPEQAQQRSE